MHKQHLIFVYLMSFILAGVTAAKAEWSHTNNADNEVEVSPLAVDNMQKSVSDGNGGVIVVYVRHASAIDLTYNVYAQRLDRDGNPVWGTPVLVLDIDNTETALAEDLEIMSDGNGGVFVAIPVTNYGDHQILTQYVESGGIRSWSVAGTPVVSYPTGAEMTNCKLADNSDGGFIVAWEDSRNSVSTGIDVWAQNFDDGGSRLWGNDGVSVCSAAGSQENLAIVSDGNYGSFVIWEDTRDGLDKIYGQNILESGNVGWALQGELLMTGEAGVFLPVLCRGGSGNGFLMGAAGRVSGVFQIRLSEIDENGNNAWFQYVTTSTANHQHYPSMITDGQGGAFVAWKETSASQYDQRIGMQRIARSGALRWSSSGVDTGPFDNGHIYGTASLVSDNRGGVIATWIDYTNNYDIYSQRFSENGVAAWDQGGLILSYIVGQAYSLSTVPDGRGGAVATWISGQVGVADVFAKRVGYHGRLGDANPAISGVADYPQDQGGVVRLDWTRSYLDDFEYQAINNYTIWRRYGAAKNSTSATAAELEKQAKHLAAQTGLDPKLLTTQMKAGWSLIDQVDAYLWAEYSYEAPTYADSTEAGITPTEFKIVAHESQFVYWESDVVAGYSVDNLAPAAPLMLAATYLVPDGLLQWSPDAADVPDLAGYRVYRSSVPGFVPDAGSFVGTTTDTTYTDVGLATGTWYYVVTAADDHGNQSTPSNEAQLQAAVSAVGDNTPLAFRVSRATPNPFNPSTTIHFALAEAAPATVRIFDTRGRQVRQLLSESLAAGPHTKVWDGQDDQGHPLPSGVYLARVVAGAEHGVIKMILAK